VSRNVLDTCPDPHPSQSSEDTQESEGWTHPRSSHYLRNSLERFPQSCKLLVRCHLLFGQILNGFHPLHKISVSTKPNQLSTSELFFGMSLYLFSPIMTRLNQYLHIFNISQ
jgi:hypothetical protein